MINEKEENTQEGEEEGRYEESTGQGEDESSNNIQTTDLDDQIEGNNVHHETIKNINHIILFILIICYYFTIILMFSLAMYHSFLEIRKNVTHANESDVIATCVNNSYSNLKYLR